MANIFNKLSPLVFAPLFTEIIFILFPSGAKLKVNHANIQMEYKCFEQFTTFDILVIESIWSELKYWNWMSLYFIRKLRIEYIGSVQFSKWNNKYHELLQIFNVTVNTS